MPRNTSAVVQSGATTRFDPRNIWQTGWVVIALVGVALFLLFVIDDAGTVLFTLLLAWFASIAMEPAVGRLARRMPRSAATGIVMGSVALFIVIFMLAFGQLLATQIAQLLQAVPSLVEAVVDRVNSGLAIVFLLIGMPYWLALAIWTGVIAQLIPTIGTYIAIALPVLVGLLSTNPWLGAIALAWGVIYQQIENLTIEPRISARAVNVHPAVAFAAVMFGTALFGIPGALLGIPVAAMLIALGESRHKRYELCQDLDAPLATRRSSSDEAQDRTCQEDLPTTPAATIQGAS